jgi:hypothetical protein
LKCLFFVSLRHPSQIISRDKNCFIFRLYTQKIKLTRMLCKDNLMVEGRKNSESLPKKNDLSKPEANF